MNCFCQEAAPISYNPSIAEQKSLIRQDALLRRQALEPSFRQQASHIVAQHALILKNLAKAHIVAGYWPLRDEVDSRPLIDALIKRGQIIALPRIQDGHLVFLRWTPDAPLVEGPYGLLEPPSDAPALLPEAILVPLVAFDKQGHRLGYGKGYYDRTIATMSKGGRPLLIGLAFAVQEERALPVEVHDQKLDVVVTEKGYCVPNANTQKNC